MRISITKFEIYITLTISCFIILVEMLRTVTNYYFTKPEAVDISGKSYNFNFFLKEMNFRILWFSKLLLLLLF